MRCALARRWILRALADDLSERRGRALAGHLAGCSACRTEARASGALWREIGAAASADPGPPYWEALPARVRRRIGERAARPGAVADGDAVRRRQEIGCRAAIAAALAVTAGLAVLEKRPAPPPDAAAALVEALRAPGIVAQVVPPTLEVEDPDLEMQDSLARLTPEEARALRSRLEREIGLSRLPRKETYHGS